MRRLLIFPWTALLALATAPLAQAAAPSLQVLDGRAVPPLSIFQGPLSETLEPAPKTSEEVLRIARHFQAVARYFQGRFGYAGTDGQGSEVRVIALFREEPANAGWLPEQKTYFVGPDTEESRGWSQALDVVAHEFVHGIIQHTSGLERTGMPGAVNEHLADVFGTMIRAKLSGERTPSWVFGTSIRALDDDGLERQGIRDLLHPSRSFVPQPEQLSQVAEGYLDPACEPNHFFNDDCGVHYLDGILNRAISQAAIELGWERLEPLLYRVMTRDLRPRSGFAEYRDALLRECDAETGACSALERSFKSVGL